MSQFLLFLHVVGAVGLGFYLVLPFMMMRITGLTNEALQPYLNGLYGTSRIGQYLLVIQLLTGGYLISQSEYTVMWIILSIVFFIIIGALSGIMNKNLKVALKHLNNNETAEQPLGTAKSLSIIVSLSLLVILYIMMYPIYQ
jgi:hypothetical protein